MEFLYGTFSQDIKITTSWQSHKLLDASIQAQKHWSHYDTTMVFSFLPDLNSLAVAFLMLKEQDFSGFQISVSTVDICFMPTHSTSILHSQKFGSTQSAAACIHRGRVGRPPGLSAAPVTGWSVELQVNTKLLSHRYFRLKNPILLCETTENLDIQMRQQKCMQVKLQEALRVEYSNCQATGTNFTAFI